MHNCFDGMINKKNLNPNKIKINEKIFTFTRSIILEIKNGRCKILKILIFRSLCQEHLPNQICDDQKTQLQNN